MSRTILAQAVDGTHPCVAAPGNHICTTDNHKNISNRIAASPTFVMKTIKKNVSMQKDLVPESHAKRITCLFCNRHTGIITC
jgi:hypothetical protein